MAQPLQYLADYITQCRGLLQDQVPVYRYDDDTLVNALNNGIIEMYAKRPDLFIGVRNIPFYAVDYTGTIAIDLRYRNALVYFMAGYCQLRDDEVNQDGRATVFIGKFEKQLMQVAG